MKLSSLDRRVIQTLRDKALKRPARGPRIAVVGNCQSFGVAYAMKLLNVEATVHRFPVLFKSWTNAKILARALKRYDYVFLQPFPPGLVRGASSDDVLNELGGRATLFPSLIFTAYHPDTVFVHDQMKQGAQVWGPIGPYHSGLAFFAYRAGLSLEAALKLYNREVFDAVGYYDVWQDATDALLEAGRQFSLDLREDLLRWTRRGCFMYSINHPKWHVLFDVARQLANNAGVPATPVNFDNYTVDDLVLGVVYPVYPALADFYGIEGSYIFKGAHFHLDTGVGHFWDLRQFIQECYRIYAKHQPDKLTNERVQNWLNDAEVSAFLRGVAQANGSGALPAERGRERSGAGLAVGASLG